MVSVVRPLEVITIIVSLVFLLESCSKKATSSSSQGRHQQVQSASGSTKSSTSGSGTVKLEPVAPRSSNAPPSPPPPTSPPAIVAVEGTDRLMTIRGAPPVFPSDYEIGALQSSAPTGTEQGEILQVVRRFFSALSLGKDDTALLSPHWKDDMIRRLRYPLTSGELPTAVRIGVLQVEGEKAHAPIRLEKGQGRATGEVYLERVENRWYISDIQMDFAQLAKPFKRTQTFDPSEWKSMVRK